MVVSFIGGGNRSIHRKQYYWWRKSEYPQKAVLLVEETGVSTESSFMKVGIVISKEQIFLLRKRIFG
jgi:hypothetical protein